MNIAILTEFFMWCTIINFGLLLLSAIICMCSRKLIHRVHGKMFDLSQNTINTMMYGFLGFYKLVFIVFMLVPWIALLIIG